MKVRTILFLVARVSLSAGIVLLIGQGVAYFAFHFMTGFDPRYDMGENYEIWSPNPKLLRLDEHGIYRVIGPEWILQVAFTDKWIIGNTDKGWFAVNKKTHDVNYPCSSETEVRAITGVTIPLLEATWENLLPYNLALPEAKRVVAVIHRKFQVLAFLAFVIIGFGPPVVTVLFRRRGKQ